MSAYRTRRATVDDLPQLTDLWKAAQLPAADLEKRFTEFQVAEDEVGKLIAAIGLHIEASNGCVHSETIADFSLTDSVRPDLWKRMQTVAQNHGLFRVWTREAAPWWKKDAGFTIPAPEVLEKLPESFGPRDAGWFMLQLKSEGADPEFLEKEMARFKEAEREEREKLMDLGRWLRGIGTGIAALAFIFAIIVAYFVFRNHLFDRLHRH